MFWGILLVLLGTLWLLDTLGMVSLSFGDIVIPVVVLALGFHVLFRRKNS